MFIFITVGNKGFHKANGISMPLKLKGTQRNLSSANRGVHSYCTRFSMTTPGINPTVPGALSTPVTHTLRCLCSQQLQPTSFTFPAFECCVTQKRQLRAVVQFASVPIVFSIVCILISNIFYLVCSALERFSSRRAPSAPAAPRRAQETRINNANNNY